MRFAIVLAVIAAGCGRLDFEIRGDATGVDAPLDAAIPCTPVVPAYVQSDCNTNHGQPATSALAVTTNASITVGNLLVVAVDFDGTTASVALADSLGNRLQAAAPIARSTAQSDQIWYAVVTTAGVDTVTATFDSSTSGIGVYAHEYVGLATAATFDQLVTGTGTTGMVLTTTTATTAMPDELLFAHGMTPTMITTPGAGFTQRESCNGNMTEDQLAIAPGVYSASFTASSNASWLTSMAAFRPCM